MKLTIFLSDGGHLTIQNFDSASALDLAESLPEQRFATFEMDGSTILVNVDHIVRLDIDQ